MKAAMFVLMLVAANAAAAQEGNTNEQPDPKACIGVMENAVKDELSVSQGFNPASREWRKVRAEADACSRWHNNHIEDPRHRELFQAAVTAYDRAMKVPSMNTFMQFSQAAIEFSWAK